MPTLRGIERGIAVTDMAISEENIQSNSCETESISPKRIHYMVGALERDLPSLFERDIAYDIYSQDICFTDPISTFNGKFGYRIVYWTLRFHGQLFFTHIELDLHDVKQTAPDHIEAHWTVKGTLRLPWKPKIYFNGTSNYSINSEGLIYKHVDTWDRKPTEVLKQFFRRG
jgi:hypothetical protein